MRSLVKNFEPPHMRILTFTPPPLAVTVTQRYALDSEASMAAYMLDTAEGGPIAAVVDASEWQTYTHGTITSCGMDVNHAVQITGVNLNADEWRIRNSWDTGKTKA